ncbi:hypothetical protein AB751O23_AS_00010, partial [Chlamydiales bacterium SCGC AB-751-O23]
MLYQESDKLVEKSISSIQTDLNVLFIPSNIEDGDYLASIANENTLVLEFDANSSNLNILLEGLSKTLGGRKADSIAFATHGDEGFFQLTDEVIVSQSSLESSTDLQSFFSKLALFLEEDGRVDLLGCNVAGNEEGLELLKDLEELTQRNFAASTDLTGSSIFEANWVLETDAIDASSTYFTSNESLDQWEHELNTVLRVNLTTGANSQSRADVVQERSAEEEAIWYWDPVEADLKKVINSNTAIVGSGGEAGGQTLIGKIYGKFTVIPSWTREYHTDGWTQTGFTNHYHSAGLYMHVNAGINIQNNDGHELYFDRIGDIRESNMGYNLGELDLDEEGLWTGRDDWTLNSHTFLNNSDDPFLNDAVSKRYVVRGEYVTYTVDGGLFHNDTQSIVWRGQDFVAKPSRGPINWGLMQFDTKQGNSDFQGYSDSDSFGWQVSQWDATRVMGDAYIPIYFDSFNENLNRNTTGGSIASVNDSIKVTDFDNTDGRAQRDFDYEGFSSAYMHTYYNVTGESDPYFSVDTGINFEEYNSLANKKFGPVVVGLWQDNKWTSNAGQTGVDWTKKLEISEVNELTSRFVQPTVHTLHYSGQSGFEDSSSTGTSITDKTLSSDRHYDGLYFPQTVTPTAKVIRTALIRQLEPDEIGTIGNLPVTGEKTIFNHSQEVRWGYNEENQFAVVKEVLPNNATNSTYTAGGTVSDGSAGFAKGDVVLRIFKSDIDRGEGESNSSYLSRRTDAGSFYEIKAPFDGAYFFPTDSGADGSLIQYGDSLGFFAETLGTVGSGTPIQQIPATNAGTFKYSTEISDGTVTTAVNGLALGSYEDMKFERGDLLFSTQTAPATGGGNTLNNQFAEYSGKITNIDGPLEILINDLLGAYNNTALTTNPITESLATSFANDITYDSVAETGNIDLIKLGNIASNIESISSYYKTPPTQGEMIITNDIGEAYIPLTTHISGAAETHALISDPTQAVSLRDDGTVDASLTPDLSNNNYSNLAGKQGTDIVSIYTPTENAITLQGREGFANSHLRTLSPNFVAWDDDVKGNPELLQIEISNVPKYGTLTYNDDSLGDITIAKGDVINLDDIYTGKVSYKLNNATVGDISLRRIPLTIPQFADTKYKILYEKSNSETGQDDVIFSIFELKAKHEYESTLEDNLPPGTTLADIFPTSQAGIAYKGEILAIIEDESGKTFEIRASETGKYVQTTTGRSSVSYTDFNILPETLGTLEIVQTITNELATPDREEWQDGFKFTISDLAHGDLAFANQYWQINLFDLLPKGKGEVGVGWIIEDRETEKTFNVLGNDYDPDSNWEDMTLKIENISVPKFSSDANSSSEDIIIDHDLSSDDPVVLESNTITAKTIVQTGDVLSTVRSDLNTSDLLGSIDGSTITESTITIDEVHNQIKLPSKESIISDDAFYSIKKQTNIYAPEEYNHPTLTGNLITTPIYSVVSTVIDVDASHNASTIHLTSAGDPSSREPTSYDRIEIDRIFSDIKTPELNLLSSDFINAKFELSLPIINDGSTDVIQYYNTSTNSFDNTVEVEKGDTLLIAKVVDVESDEEIILHVTAPYKGVFKLNLDEIFGANSAEGTQFEIDSTTGEITDTSGNVIKFAKDIKIAEIANPRAEHNDPLFQINKVKDVTFSDIGLFTSPSAFIDSSSNEVSVGHYLVRGINIVDKEGYVLEDTAGTYDFTVLTLEAFDAFGNSLGTTDKKIDFEGIAHLKQDAVIGASGSTAPKSLELNDIIDVSSANEIFMQVKNLAVIGTNIEGEFAADTSVKGAFYDSSGSETFKEGDVFDINASSFDELYFGKMKDAKVNANDVIVTLKDTRGTAIEADDTIIEVRSPFTGEIVLDEERMGRAWLTSVNNLIPSNDVYGGPWSVDSVVPNGSKVNVNDPIITVRDGGHVTTFKSPSNGIIEYDETLINDLISNGNTIQISNLLINLYSAGQESMETIEHLNSLGYIKNPEVTKGRVIATLTRTDQPFIEGLAYDANNIDFAKTKQIELVAPISGIYKDFDMLAGIDLTFLDPEVSESSNLTFENAASTSLDSNSVQYIPNGFGSYTITTSDTFILESTLSTGDVIIVGQKIGELRDSNGIGFRANVLSTKTGIFTTTLEADINTSISNSNAVFGTIIEPLSLTPNARYAVHRDIVYEEPNPETEESSSTKLSTDVNNLIYASRSDEIEVDDTYFPLENAEDKGDLLLNPLHPNSDGNSIDAADFNIYSTDISGNVTPDQGASLTGNNFRIAGYEINGGTLIDTAGSVQSSMNTPGSNGQLSLYYGDKQYSASTTVYTNPNDTTSPSYLEASLSTNTDNDKIATSKDSVKIFIQQVDSTGADTTADQITIELMTQDTLDAAKTHRIREMLTSNILRAELEAAGLLNEEFDNNGDPIYENTGTDWLNSLYNSGYGTGTQILDDSNISIATGENFILSNTAADQMPFDVGVNKGFAITQVITTTVTDSAAPDGTLPTVTTSLLTLRPGDSLTPVTANTSVTVGTVTTETVYTQSATITDTASKISYGAETITDKDNSGDSDINYSGLIQALQEKYYLLEHKDKVFATWMPPTTSTGLFEYDVDHIISGEDISSGLIFGDVKIGLHESRTDNDGSQFKDLSTPADLWSRMKLLKDSTGSNPNPITIKSTFGSDPDEAGGTGFGITQGEVYRSSVLSTNSEGDLKEIRIFNPDTGVVKSDLDTYGIGYIDEFQLEEQKKYFFNIDAANPESTITANNPQLQNQLYTDMSYDYINAKLTDKANILNLQTKINEINPDLVTGNEGSSDSNEYDDPYGGNNYYASTPVVLMTANDVQADKVDSTYWTNRGAKGADGGGTGLEEGGDGRTLYLLNRHFAGDDLWSKHLGGWWLHQSHGKIYREDISTEENGLDKLLVGTDFKAGIGNTNLNNPLVGTTDDPTGPGGQEFTTRAVGLHPKFADKDQALKEIEEELSEELGILNSVIYRPPVDWYYEGAAATDAYFTKTSIYDGVEYINDYIRYRADEVLPDETPVKKGDLIMKMIRFYQEDSNVDLKINGKTNSSGYYDGFSKDERGREGERNKIDGRSFIMEIIPVYAEYNGIFKYAPGIQTELDAEGNIVNAVDTDYNESFTQQNDDGTFTEQNVRLYTPRDSDDALLTGKERYVIENPANALSTTHNSSLTSVSELPIFGYLTGIEFEKGDAVANYTKNSISKTGFAENDGVVLQIPSGTTPTGDDYFASKTIGEFLTTDTAVATTFVSYQGQANQTFVPDPNVFIGAYIKEGTRIGEIETSGVTGGEEVKMGAGGIITDFNAEALTATDLTYITVKSFVHSDMTGDIKERASGTSENLFGKSSNLILKDIDGELSLVRVSDIPQTKTLDSSSVTVTDPTSDLTYTIAGTEYFGYDAAVTDGGFITEGQVIGKLFDDAAKTTAVAKIKSILGGKFTLATPTVSAGTMTFGTLENEKSLDAEAIHPPTSADFNLSSITVTDSGTTTAYTLGANDIFTFDTGITSGSYITTGQVIGTVDKSSGGTAEIKSSQDGWYVPTPQANIRSSFAVPTIISFGTLFDKEPATITNNTLTNYGESFLSTTKDITAPFTGEYIPNTSGSADPGDSISGNTATDKTIGELREIPWIISEIPSNIQFEMSPFSFFEIESITDNPYILEKDSSASPNLATGDAIIDFADKHGLDHLKAPKSGYLDNLDEIHLNSTRYGAIAKIHFDAGDTVKKGDVLYTLENGQTIRSPFAGDFQNKLSVNVAANPNRLTYEVLDYVKDGDEVKQGDILLTIVSGLETKKVIAQHSGVFIHNKSILSDADFAIDDQSDLEIVFGSFDTPLGYIERIEGSIISETDSTIAYFNNIPISPENTGDFLNKDISGSIPILFGGSQLGTVNKSSFNYGETLFKAIQYDEQGNWDTFDATAGYNGTFNFNETRELSTDDNPSIDNYVVNEAGEITLGTLFFDKNQTMYRVQTDYKVGSEITPGSDVGELLGASIDFTSPVRAVLDFTHDLVFNPQDNESYNYHSSLRIDSLVGAGQQDNVLKIVSDEIANTSTTTSWNSWEFDAATIATNLDDAAKKQKFIVNVSSGQTGVAQVTDTAIVAGRTDVTNAEVRVHVNFRRENNIPFPSSTTNIPAGSWMIFDGMIRSDTLTITSNSVLTPSSAFHPTDDIDKIIVNLDGQGMARIKSYLPAVPASGSTPAVAAYFTFDILQDFLEEVGTATPNWALMDPAELVYKQSVQVEKDLFAFGNTAGSFNIEYIAESNTGQTAYTSSPTFAEGADPFINSYFTASVEMQASNLKETVAKDDLFGWNSEKPSAATDDPFKSRVWNKATHSWEEKTLLYEDATKDYQVEKILNEGRDEFKSSNTNAAKILGDEFQLFVIENDENLNTFLDKEETQIVSLNGEEAFYQDPFSAINITLDSNFDHLDSQNLHISPALLNSNGSFKSGTINVGAGDLLFTETTSLTGGNTTDRSMETQFAGKFLFDYYDDGRDAIRYTKGAGDITADGSGGITGTNDGILDTRAYLPELQEDFYRYEVENMETDGIIVKAGDLVATLKIRIFDSHRETSTYGTTPAPDILKDSTGSYDKIIPVYAPFSGVWKQNPSALGSGGSPGSEYIDASMVLGAIDKVDIGRVWTETPHGLARVDEFEEFTVANILDHRENIIVYKPYKVFDSGKLFNSTQGEVETFTYGIKDRIQDEAQENSIHQIELDSKYQGSNVIVEGLLLSPNDDITEGDFLFTLTQDASLSSLKDTESYNLIALLDSNIVATVGGIVEHVDLNDLVDFKAPDSSDSSKEYFIESMIADGTEIEKGDVVATLRADEIAGKNFQGKLINPYLKTPSVDTVSKSFVNTSDLKYSVSNVLLDTSDGNNDGYITVSQFDSIITTSIEMTTTDYFPGKELTDPVERPVDHLFVTGDTINPAISGYAFVNKDEILATITHANLTTTNILADKDGWFKPETLTGLSNGNTINLGALTSNLNSVSYTFVTGDPTITPISDTFVNKGDVIYTVTHSDSSTTDVLASKDGFFKGASAPSGTNTGDTVNLGTITSHIGSVTEVIPNGWVNEGDTILTFEKNLEFSLPTSSYTSTADIQILNNTFVTSDTIIAEIKVKDGITLIDTIEIKAGRDGYFKVDLKNNGVPTTYASGTTETISLGSIENSITAISSGEFTLNLDLSSAISGSGAELLIGDPIGEISRDSYAPFDGMLKYENSVSDGSVDLNDLFANLLPIIKGHSTQIEVGDYELKFQNGDYVKAGDN